MHFATTALNFALLVYYNSIKWENVRGMQTFEFNCNMLSGQWILHSCRMTNTLRKFCELTDCMCLMINLKFSLPDMERPEAIFGKSKLLLFSWKWVSVTEMNPRHDIFRVIGIKWLFWTIIDGILLLSFPFFFFFVFCIDCESKNGKNAIQGKV